MFFVVPLNKGGFKGVVCVSGIFYNPPRPPFLRGISASHMPCVSLNKMNIPMCDQVVFKEHLNENMAG